MIWHETTSPSVIVMLTQTHEAGREKCFQYFPLNQQSPTVILEDTEDFPASVKLVNVEEDTTTHATVREIDIVVQQPLEQQGEEENKQEERPSESKKVWHLLFSGWPDFLVPEGNDREALLQLLKQSEDKNASHDNPRIVHCSAGVGRSGTFIALDWLLTELGEGSFDDMSDEADDRILDVVKQLRDQRMYMVQAEPQFFFLYEVLKEQWLERWKNLHPEEALSMGEEVTMETRDAQKMQEEKLIQLGAEAEAEIREQVER